MDQGYLNNVTRNKTMNPTTTTNQPNVSFSPMVEERLVTLKPNRVVRDSGQVLSYAMPNDPSKSLLPRETSDKRCRAWTNDESKLVISMVLRGKSVYAIRKAFNKEISMMAIKNHLKYDYGVEI